jgi:tRNA threonylcarbamoyladenosine biosynthesis protein TsaE
MTGASWQCPLPDEGRVGELARVVRQHLRAPLVIWLRGELGAGKTTFARALIRGLGYPGRVKSPTYGILETYNAGGLNVLHLDLYRIEVPAELDQIAIRDLFDENSLLLVEWPERGGTHLPGADLDLHLVKQQDGRYA